MTDTFDLIIKNIDIVDGSGKPLFHGNIGIKGEKIAAVGDEIGGAEKTIDGEGLTACPGFIDSHSHADLTILNQPAAENLIMQGITSFVGGHCGITLAPLKNLGYFEDLKKVWGFDYDPGWRSFGEWMAEVEAKGIGPNYIPLVGHNAVRGAVLGTGYYKKADDNEIAEMDGFVREAMESGAFGISIGLDANSPGHFAERGELLRLLATVKEHSGIFSPHTRHHQNQWPSSSADENAYGLYQGPKGELFTGRYHGLLEAVELAKLAGNIKLLIAHLTPSYSIPHPHSEFLDSALATATLDEIIDGPVAEGLDVYFNIIPCEYSIGSQLPIAASFFNPNLSLPGWLKSLSKADFAGRLRDKGFADKVRDFVFSGKFKFGMINPVTDPYWMDCYQVLTCKNGDFVGKTIGEAARERSPDNIFKAVYEESMAVVFEILFADPDATWALVRDKREYGVLETFLKNPRAIPMTDVPAMAKTPTNSRGIFGYGVSPAVYNMFPNYLSDFVKEKNTLSLEEAVRRLTSLPARDVFDIKDRGLIAPGMYADIVIMDPDKLKANNDFLKPNTNPSGIEYVFVNGKTAYDQGRQTGVKPGKVLRRS
jgi:N-acyl-D-amino-acid deacylase